MIPSTCEHVKKCPSPDLSYENISQMKTPTKLSINIPQAERGFITTSSELSSLAPNS